MKTRTLVLSNLVVVSLVVVGTTAAQPAPSRLEVGAQASLVRSSDFRTTSAGLGGRVSFDVARWATVEAEASYFPNDDVRLPPSTVVPALRVTYERRRIDAFFGVKLGLRGDRFGVFAKARPGMTRLTGRGGAECRGGECPLVLLLAPRYRTEFALDLGSVFEFYPSARTVARIDLGDMIIRHRSTAPPCWGSTCTSHNLSSRFGIGIRF